MGVMGTFCQICEMPVQHDHYFPLEPESLWGIYRGKDPSSSKGFITFGPEHDWLKDAIGLKIKPEQSPIFIECPVEDGVFYVAQSGEQPTEPCENVFVFEGNEERMAMHRVCYELAGHPECWSPSGNIPASKILGPYKGQLFDFWTLMGNGLGWTMVDPSEPSAEGRQNRDRILQAVAHYHGTSPPADARGPSCEDLLRFLVSKNGNRLELSAGVEPKMFRNQESISHPYEKASVVDWFPDFFAEVFDREIHALKKTGYLKTNFGVQDIGEFVLMMSLEDKRLHTTFLTA
jgi:hypothetical protein